MADLARLGIQVENNAPAATKDLRGLEEQSKKTEGATNSLANAAKRQMTDMDKLRAAYDPLYAAQMKYRQGLADLKALKEADVVKGKQYSAMLTALKGDFAEQVKSFADGIVFGEYGDGLLMQYSAANKTIDFRPYGMARRCETRSGPNDIDGTPDQFAAGEETIMAYDSQLVGDANQSVFVLFGYRNSSSTTSLFGIRSQAFGTGEQLAIGVDSQGGEFTWFHETNGKHTSTKQLKIDTTDLPALLLMDDQPAIDFQDTNSPATSYRTSVLSGEYKVANLTAGSVPFKIDVNGRPYFANHQTTASGANAYIDSSTGELIRSTSTLAKKHIETRLDGSFIGLIDQLEPFLYRSLAVRDDQERFYIGLGAEDVAPIAPWLVEYHENGSGELVPGNVMYDRLGVLTMHELVTLKRAVGSRLDRIEAALNLH